MTEQEQCAIIGEKEIIIKEQQKEIARLMSLVESLRDVFEEIFSCSNKDCNKYNPKVMGNCGPAYINQLVNGTFPCDWYTPTIDLKQVKYGDRKFKEEYNLRTKDIVKIRGILEDKEQLGGKQMSKNPCDGCIIDKSQCPHCSCNPKRYGK